MKSQPTYATVFQALSDVRKNLDEKLNLLIEQIRRAQLESVEDAFRQQKDALAECLDGIDQQLINLSVYVDEYRRLYASVQYLNEKIASLGGEPGAMPEPVTDDNFVAMLTARIVQLQSEAKI
jgi:hypothetical protein